MFCNYIAFYRIFSCQSCSIYYSKHCLAIQRVGCRSYLTGSIHGYSRLHLTCVGRLLTRRAQAHFAVSLNGILLIFLLNRMRNNLSFCLCSIAAMPTKHKTGNLLVNMIQFSALTQPHQCQVDAICPKLLVSK